VPRPHLEGAMARRPRLRGAIEVEPRRPLRAPGDTGIRARAGSGSASPPLRGPPLRAAARAFRAVPDARSLVPRRGPRRALLFWAAGARLKQVAHISPRQRARGPISGSPPGLCLGSHSRAFPRLLLSPDFHFSGMGWFCRY
jgi:hypothetical protein